MKQNFTRREFIKAASMGVLAFSAASFLPIEKVFAAGDVSAKTRYGTFNGFVDKNGVKTWLGIPFAEPPVGKLRWQAPQKLKPTDETFDAKKFGASPMQETIKIVQTVDKKHLSSKISLGGVFQCTGRRI